MIDRISRQHGHLDALVVNAGITRPMPLGEVTEAVDDMFDVSAEGSFFTVQRSQPLLGPGSSIVLTVGLGVSGGLR